MSATILAESYLMAYGYASSHGATECISHLFARNFDMPVTAKQVQSAWESPAPSGRAWDVIKSLTWEEWSK